MYFLFSPALCSRYTPTRQYFTRVRQSATRESNSDACREMDSHYLSKGIRMGEQHPVISLPLGLRGGMDAESGDRRGKRTEEGPQHPSLCFCIWGSISYTLCLFEAPKDHIYFLTMEQVSSLGAIYSEFSLFYQIRNSPFFKESLKKTPPAQPGMAQ